mgnify:CR=1 FL=1
MSTVFCRKFQENLDSLDRPPFPGETGQYIYENFSEKAWDEWLAHQKRLINEKHLELFEPDTRQYLQEQMLLFLNNKHHDLATGYVPKNKP